MSMKKGTYFRKDIDNEVLRHQYVDLQMSTTELAEQYKCSATTIKLRLVSIGVTIRDSSLRVKLGQKKIDRKKYKIDKDWLQDKYINQKYSISKIASEIGCSDSVVSKALDYYSISRRSQLESNRLIDRSDWDFSYLQITKKHKHDGDLSEIKISKEELYQKYILDKRSAFDISKDYNCSNGTIKYKLQKFGIPMRTPREACKTGYWEGKIKNTGRESYIEHDNVPENPQNGFEINGKLIGKKGTYLWLACSKCGIGRWVSKSNSKRSKTNGLCYNCMQIDENRTTKISNTHKERYKDPKVREELGERSRKVWAREGYKDMHVKLTMKACAMRPTKPELEVLDILNALYPNEWKYSGNGDVILGGKNPDIINVNGYKAVIEMNGTFWHSRTVKGECPLLHELHRIEHFKKYGYSTLVIWEHELVDKNQTIKKIQAFHSEISKSHH